MKSFTIRCNECGKETTFSKPKDSYFITKENSNVDVFCSDYGGEIKFICECGNEIEDGR